MVVRERVMKNPGLVDRGSVNTPESDSISAGKVIGGCTIEGLIAVGGMGSIPGVILGAVVLIGLPEVLREVQQYRMLAFGALLVVMMIFRPTGFIPSARRRMEFKDE